VNPANGIKTLTRDEEPSVSISFDCVAIKEKKRKKGKKKREGFYLDYGEQFQRQ
jgi:hypothetical protein